MLSETSQREKHAWHGVCVPLYGNFKKEKKRRPERRSLGTGKGEGEKAEEEWMGMNNTQCLSVWKYHNEAGYGGTYP
jgi:hypothetical protein